MYKVVFESLTFQSLAHNTSIERHAGQKLGVVVGMKFDESLASVVEEIGQRRVAVRRQSDLVVLGPDDDADESDVDVQRRVESVHHVGDVLAYPVDLVDVRPVLDKLLVVDDEDELDKPRPDVGVPRTLDVRFRDDRNFGRRRNVPFVSEHPVVFIRRGLERSVVESAFVIFGLFL